jgi:hypothetical protein
MVAIMTVVAATVAQDVVAAVVVVILAFLTVSAVLVEVAVKSKYYSIIFI